jgi:hypothetical protein
MAAAVGLTVSVPFVLLLDRREVLVIHEVEIVPNPVAPGGQLTLNWTATERRNCAGVVNRRIIDSRGVVVFLNPVPTVYHDLMVATPRRFATTFSIPRSVSPGPATYVSNVLRWCNVLQETIWPMTFSISVQFTIGEPA